MEDPLLEERDSIDDASAADVSVDYRKSRVPPSIKFNLAII